MSKPLAEYSLQEAYDIIKAGMENQNWERSMNGLQCRYRGNNKTKCAVGHIIPDEYYTSFCEGYEISDLIDKAEGSRMKIASFLKNVKDNDELYSFLRKCQELHDNHSDRSEIGLKQKFINYANRIGLNS